MRKFNIAVIQLDTQNDKKKNLETAAEFIKEAVSKNAKIISFPEVMNLVGKNVGEGGQAEPIPGYTTDFLCSEAKKYGVYIHGGSITELIPSEKKFYNTTVMIDDKGEIIAKYRKLHTFDVTLPDGTVNMESEKVLPGEDVVTVDTEYGKLGFSICYDIRFPELFRLLAIKGAQIIFTPANFTMPTGKDHWDTILRTRAIENTCYIVAAGQIGKKTNFTAFGNSMIVDPWGTIITKAKDEPSVAVAEIDLDYLDRIRAKMPSLKNRRSDIYDVIIK